MLLGLSKQKKGPGALGEVYSFVCCLCCDHGASSCTAFSHVDLWEIANMAHSWPRPNMEACTSLMVIPSSWLSSSTNSCILVTSLFWVLLGVLISSRKSHEKASPHPFFLFLGGLFLLNSFCIIGTSHTTFKTCVIGRGYWEPSHSPDFLHLWKYNIVILFSAYVPVWHEHVSVPAGGHDLIPHWLRNCYFKEFHELFVLF